MSVYTASQGDTWDSISYKITGDEFQFIKFVESNYDLREIVVFEGGEVVTIPDDVQNYEIVIESPWTQNNNIRVISAPWGLYP